MVQKFVRVANDSTLKVGDLIRSDNTPNHINLVLEVFRGEYKYGSNTMVRSVRFAHIHSGDFNNPAKITYIKGSRSRVFRYGTYANSWYRVKLAEITQKDIDLSAMIISELKRLEGVDTSYRPDPDHSHED